MAPFYGWGSTASRIEPLRGGILLFTTKFPEIPGTHFIDLGRMKEWKSGVTQGRFYSLLFDEYGKMLVSKFMIRHKYEIFSFLTELTK